MHPKWGVRPAQFCRMPVLWDILRQDPSIEYLVHIGKSPVIDCIYNRRNSMTDPSSPSLVIHPRARHSQTDSDALFRSTNYSVQRHFDELSESQPIGFMNNGPWQPHTPCTGYYVMKQGRNLAPAEASPSPSLLRWAAGAKKPAPRTIVTDFLRLWWDQDWHLNLCDGELKDQCTLWTLLQYGECCFDM
jgi:hypothetical protein